MNSQSSTELESSEVSNAKTEARFRITWEGEAWRGTGTRSAPVLRRVQIVPPARNGIFRLPGEALGARARPTPKIEL